ncbi:hypothetical protein Dda_1569 [Drechslerella dactyloides]|uniref:carboxypeptidase C n=1 Tax=Drechslerella dactyloides TaxID=74499 RepID=A0AAD6J6C9_DREDA|nr:hypothetical protein Dda_1569 [Drechslerella dactyloides]
MKLLLEIAILAPPALGFLYLPRHHRQPAVDSRDFLTKFGHITQKPLGFDARNEQTFLIAGQPVPKEDPYPADDAAGIRIHPVDERVCKSGSRQLTGHVNVTQHKSLFWWFHESRRDPKNDPLIIWLNGGPGASSLFGGMTELGPCNIDEDGKNTTYNKYSWSNFANILFVDQPAGVGFSTATNDTYFPYTADVAAADFSTFLRRLFKHVLPDYASHKIHLMGESFAGVYYPSILAKILDQQQRLAELGLPNPFPKIESMVLADALVEWASSKLGTYRTVCISRPDETGVDECRLSKDGPTCMAAAETCIKMEEAFWDLTRKGKRSPYDMRSDCPDRELCLSSFSDRMNTYFNKPATLSLLGLPETTKYMDTNYEINSRWSDWAFDTVIPTLDKVSRILEESSVRVLVYNGNSDFLINTAGVLEWMHILPWSGNGEFRSRDLQPWHYAGENSKSIKGGMRKSTKNGKLAFASIDRAGHMAPFDQPAALEALVKAWVEDKEL